MGNIRHSFNTSNQETTFSQMPYRLLYSSYSKYEQDWESYPHTHYFSELLRTERMRKLHCRRRIISDPKTESDHHQPEHPPHGSFRQKFSLEYIVLGVEGLNFLIYNDKEYLNIQCEDFSENLDFYFHTILREMDEQKKATRRSVKIFSKLSSFNFHDIPDRL